MNEQKNKFINAGQTDTVQQTVLESDRLRSSPSLCNRTVVLQQTVNYTKHIAPLIRLTACFHISEINCELEWLIDCQLSSQ